ncbi:MAG: DUF3102 domain-containing protein [Hyphomicrobiales bacterium]
MSAPAVIPANVVFDYTVIAADTAASLRSTATRIRDRMNASIIETGRDLAAVKDMLEPGTFGSWLNAEFSMTVRSAQNYMAAAALADKYETVSYLAPTAIYRLASPSTPDAVRDAIMCRVQKGEAVSKKAISDQIAQHRRQQAEKARADQLARIPPEKLKRQRRSREERARQDEARRLEHEKQQQEQTQAAQRAIAILRDRLSGDQFGEFVKLFKVAEYRFSAELLDFEHGGQRYTASIGRFPDGRLA